MIDWWHRVAMMRNERGWSRKELAERAGLHHSLISLVERGDRPGARADTLARLAGAFGISVSQLLGEDENEPAALEPYRGAINLAIQRGIAPADLYHLIDVITRLPRAGGPPRK